MPQCRGNYVIYIDRLPSYVCLRKYKYLFKKVTEFFYRLKLTSITDFQSKVNKSLHSLPSNSFIITYEQKLILKYYRAVVLTKQGPSLSTLEFNKVQYLAILTMATSR